MKSIPVTKAERPVSVQVGDPRRDARPWTRHAETGRSAVVGRTRQNDPTATLAARVRGVRYDPTADLSTLSVLAKESGPSLTRTVIKLPVAPSLPCILVSRRAKLGRRFGPFDLHQV